MVVKSKVKKKPVKTIRQKQNQKQIQNVNQIVRIYLDERKKARRKKTAPQKNLKGVGSSNLITPSFFASQNPLSNMYPLQQPYNPNFYPRPPPRPPQQTPARDSVRFNRNTAPLPSQPEIPIIPTPPSSPVARTQPVIPPGIDIPTNPLIAPPRPKNNFPDLQNDNAGNILPFMDETNSVVGVADTPLPFMDETNDEVRLADTPLPFMDETNDDVRLADTLLPNIAKINEDIKMYGDITKPSTKFNMDLEYAVEEPPAQIPSMEAEDRGAEERLSQDDLAIINRYDALRGNTKGRRPQTIDGYKKAIERMVKLKRNDEAPLREGRTRGETATLIKTPFKTGLSERERTPVGRSPVIQKRKEFAGQATKISTQQQKQTAVIPAIKISRKII